MGYAMLVHGGHTFTDTFLATLRYCIDAAAYVSVPVVAVLLIARPNARTIFNIAWPADRQRKLVAVAFWTTLLLPILPALVWRIDINAVWTMSAWTLLPVLLLSPQAVHVTRPSVRRVVRAAILLPLIMVPAAPFIALGNFKWNRLPEQQTRPLAEKVELAWQAATTKPLRFVGGNADLAYGVVTYAHCRACLPASRDELNQAALYLCVPLMTAIASQNPAALLA